MCGYLIVLSQSNTDAMAICIIKKSTNKYTNIPCLSKTVAYSSGFVPMKDSSLEIFNGTS
ncbi:hypothetical protein T01_13827 [Trichinella spiralis]|uniref:Uncharacterized protein n=1 Tax=Trichinella spiralis TaxID=6334 RepID=A0A0V1AVZ6_TRISP|nr:hypothetical protein T01_13827 [Trichinella spiralis]